MSEASGKNGAVGSGIAIGGALIRGPEMIGPVPGADTELRPRTGRRRFTAAYKLGILEQAEACAPGELGALLRREGLYSSHLTKWRRQRAAGALHSGRDSAARGVSAEALRHTAKVERENRRLRQRLERAETIIAVQKKLCSLLQVSLPEDRNS